MPALLPQSHALENEKLIVDGYVSLFRFDLDVDGERQTLFLKNNNSVNWQGHRWEGLPLSFEGYESSTLTAPRRPTFMCANPDKSFTPYLRDGRLTRGKMTRYKVLYDDILNDVNVFQKSTWIVWNVTAFSRSSIVLELRAPIDGFNVVAPPRAYRPPEFPAVVL